MARLNLRVIRSPWLIAVMALLMPVATRELAAPETPTSRKKAWVDAFRLLALLGYDYEPVSAPPSETGPKVISA